MAITPIRASSITPINLELLKQPGMAGSPATATGNEMGASFGKAVSGAIEHLGSMQSSADGLAQRAATGDLQSVQDYMVASTDAQLTTQLTVAVRNKAVEAFQEIMRMQV